MLPKRIGGLFLNSSTVPDSTRILFHWNSPPAKRDSNSLSKRNRDSAWLHNLPMVTQLNHQNYTICIPSSTPLHCRPSRDLLGSWRMIKMVASPAWSEGGTG